MESSFVHEGKVGGVGRGVGGMGGVVGGELEGESESDGKEEREQDEADFVVEGRGEESDD